MLADGSAPALPKRQEARSVKASKSNIDFVSR
jgi:hypothetical protein